MTDTKVIYMRLPADIVDKIEEYQKQQKFELTKSAVIVFALKELFRRENNKERNNKNE